MNNQIARERLMKKLQIISLSLFDTILYLDTHPTDQAALEYYHRCKRIKDEVQNEFECNFGPLTAENVKSTNKWTWVNNPWPWE